MQPEELQKLFDELDARPAEEAREKAMQAAMREFQNAQSVRSSQLAIANSEIAQGTGDPGRPTHGDASKSRSHFMHTFTQRWFYSGLASAAVLVVAVSIGLDVLDPEQVLRDRSSQRISDRAVSGSQQGNEPVRNKVAEVVAAQAAAPQAGNLEQVAVMRDLPALAGSTSAMGWNASVGAEQKTYVSDSIASLRSPQRDDSLRSVDLQQGRDRFRQFDSNRVKLVSEAPVSTFSIDVDTASYSFVRRQLNQGVLPQKDAVRIEELLNYFEYDYPAPRSRATPFEPSISVVDSPWRAGNKLVHIGIRGYDLPAAQAPDSNLVFLLDVSGSMGQPDKLPLVKQSMAMLLDQLKPTDTVAIVVYAGAAGTVLPTTPAKEKQKIIDALNRLGAGGSTAGGAGIVQAYQLARNSFKEDAVNRVILATDGDFNVGIASREELKGFVERQRDEGIFLTVLGFGQGNYHDQLMQELAQNGNGIAAYIDTLGEAQKVLADQASAMLFPIASDVKIQVEFNPAKVREYRLIGYETRALNRADFNNDKVDAGDIGAGHRVTAIYEITPTGANSGLIDSSRYQQSAQSVGDYADEYGLLKLRYKLPGESRSKLIEIPVVDAATSGVLRQELRFSLAVAGFGELLRGGENAGDWDFETVLSWASESKGRDAYGYRSEFVQLVRKAQLAQAMR